MNPYNTVFDAKRLIGRKFDDAEVQADMKHWPFKVISRSGKPAIQVEYRGEEKVFVSRILSIVAERQYLTYSRLPKKSLPWSLSR